MIMSDLSFQPIRISDAVLHDRAFRPMKMHDPVALDAAPEAVTLPESDTFSLGRESGLREAAEIFAIEKENLLHLIERANALQPEPSEELAVLIGETVNQLVADIVGRTPIAQDWLREKAHKAASLISECDNARTMWLHPDDVILLKDADISLTLMADASAERGSIRIDCSAGWIEDGLALHLDALRAVLTQKEPEA
jgi:flagellar assembly protein FliH